MNLRAEREPAVGPLDAFTVALDVVIRPCREEDLPTLEWFGMFAPDRMMIRATFEAQRAGRALMLVAEANGVASGQVWVDLDRGFLWALRVFPCLQNRGVGTRLIAAAERALAERGKDRAEISVGPENVGARKLYERLGYRLKDEGTTAQQLHLHKPLPGTGGTTPVEAL